MEIVNVNPFFMIDGAHNSNGVLALSRSLKALYPDEKFHFIMGVMADKDYEEMIDALLPLAIDFVTVTPESNRALQAKDLAECIQKKGIMASYADDLETVIAPFLTDSQEGEDSDPKTIAFGSLYFIGAIEAMLEKNKR
jgi:dihydrofolate synthase/folylpolyglutamate synthase